jgi:protein ImuA
MAHPEASLSRTPAAAPIERLRQKLSTAEKATGLTGECGRPVDFGIAAIDAALAGGFASGALHEIAAARPTEAPAATGFALAVTARFLSSNPRRHGRARPGHPRLDCDGIDVDARNKSGHDGTAVLWIVEDIALWENGAPYGPGLDEAGIPPEQLITVAASRTRDVLWAMEEALRCRAVGMVIGEIRARSIDQVATRRLSLAAATGSTLGLLLRTSPDDGPCAFATRWIVGVAPSCLLSSAERCRGIGPPRWAVHLTRNRRGHLGAWIVEWNSVEQRLKLTTHSEPVAQPFFDRPHRAAVA